MQNFGGQIRCIMGDVQVVKFYHLFAPLKYHVILRACKDGGYPEKGLMREKIINQIFQKLQKNTFKNLPLLCVFVRRISSLLDTSILNIRSHVFFIANNVELLL